MDLLIALICGIGIAIGGVGFPGMLNMTTVDLTLHEGRNSGYLYALGIGVVYAAQAGLAMTLSTLVYDATGWIEWSKEWAPFLFAALAIFFTYRALQNDGEENEDEGEIVDEAEADEISADSSDFAAGMGVALVNFIAIPYLFGFGTWFVKEDYFDGRVWGKVAFSVGAGIGAFLVFFVYARYAHWIHANARVLTRNINWLMVALFVIIGIWQAWVQYG